MSVIPLILIIMLVLSGLLGVCHVFKGETDLDRVLALDYLSIVGIAIVILVVFFTGEPLILDVGICLALVGFLTAYVFAKMAPPREKK